MTARTNHLHDDAGLLHTMSASYTSELAETLAPDLLRRFERYVRIDTQSARERRQSPSTPGQLDLGRVLVDELTEAGPRRRGTR